MDRFFAAMCSEFFRYVKEIGFLKALILLVVAIFAVAFALAMSRHYFP